MKLFQETRRSFAVLGIESTQRILNRRVIVPIMCYWIDNILNCIYLFCVDKSFNEYMDSVFFTCITSSVAICFTITIFKWNKIAAHIAVIEKFVEKRT